ncbi:MAG: hypothetical protein WAT74_11420 [Flavobacteriales bacterium]
MNPIKVIVVALFIVTSALPANAQERYEHMTILYFATTAEMFISTDTGGYKTEVGEKTDKKASWDLSPALVKCKQLSEEGWELLQTSIQQPSAYFFHLRRPLK